MAKKIHIFGASGSGTTTLAENLARELKISHFDTDNFFWLKTDPPFQKIRKLTERQEILSQALDSTDVWILSGSLCGWGDFTIPMFDLAVFLWVPPEIRLQRLKKREIKRFGEDINNPDNPQYQSHLEFMQWAAGYDSGDLNMRSKHMHEDWILKLSCPVLRIAGKDTVEKNLSRVLAYI